VSGLHTGPAQAYASLKSVFDQTKRLYSTENAFLTPSDLNLHTPEYSNILRKANLATFVSSVFSGRDAGFYYLNRYFLDTFVPDGGRLLKSQAALFLDLKTHAYIAAMSIKERTQFEILEELFPNDLDHYLLSRRTTTRLLNPTEVDFVKRARSRREHLLNEPDDEGSIAALTNKYAWEDFLRDLTTYISKNFDDLVSGSVWYLDCL
jgi:protein TBF1